MTKRKAASEFYWVIEGFDSTKKIFSTRVKATLFSGPQIEAVLKALTAKAGLSFHEIVGAYATRRTKISNSHLHIHTDVDKTRQTMALTCGSNPHFVARIVKM